jgi:hypothetical protein
LLQYDEADEKKRAQAEKLQKLELAELVKASRAQANKKGKGLLLFFFVFFQSAFVHSERIEPHICVEQMQHQRTMTHLSREWRPPL